MSKMHNVNVYRRRIMKMLTKNIGKKQNIQSYKQINPEKVKRILVSRPNQRLGNILLITPLLQELEQLFPNAKIDVIVKGTLAPIVLENYTSVDNIIELPKKPFKNVFKYMVKWGSVKTQSYDLAINPVVGSSSGKLLTSFARAKFKFYGELEEQNQEDTAIKESHIAKKPVLELRKFLGQNLNPQEVPLLNIKLSEAEKNQGKKVLFEMFSNEKPTISIFTFATGTKCYSKSWWADLYSRLKTAYPEYNILEILPFENVSQINFEAVSYYSKDIREIASVMHASHVFIGADSGIMHLATSSGTHTIGLFQVTLPECYEPYGRKNTSIFTPPLEMDEIFNQIKF